ncbi:high-affinity nickel-transport protein-domain-containing protein [Crucibulum laeve]|uniref:Nickel/cobalt efflux system n=1 Tax=Crucibulum laeve TaxID=68775 RepID=A0A5C3MI55_9AGAR|nr:high-affinity nickel-transport protein-domain-containing protein [Crucibulum laeve]
MWTPKYRLTLLGRSALLILSEIAVNVICWIVAGILFGRTHDTRQVLGLALLAWTLGLRHALDADHISAIDNATRGLINLGQLSVTCGLFFSLGHSTIVVVITVAIAISTDVYNRIHGVGTIGGIVGASVSGAFLFIIGLANSVILWKIIRRRRRDAARARLRASSQDPSLDTEGGPGGEEKDDPKHNHMIMMRILGPVITFVNRPWKMYPVGVLFGFGFDTASSIALIGVSALARPSSSSSSSSSNTEHHLFPSSYIVILPLLFTAGMTLIDSIDSVLMLYSYAGFVERGKGWKIVERQHLTDVTTDVSEKMAEGLGELPANQEAEESKDENEDEEKASGLPANDQEQKKAEGEEEKEPANSASDIESRLSRDARVKMNVMSGLSIILTLMSILVAFSISLITIMGLIGENCSACVAAAEAEDGGGLTGRWWRGWAEANEQAGYIGVAIVGAFLAIVVGWYGGRWMMRRWREKRRRA